MKKISIICLIIIILFFKGCNNSPVYWDNEISNTENQKLNSHKNGEENLFRDENSISYLDLPASRYFRIEEITKAEYLEDGIFEMEFYVLNNSNFKFSSFLGLIQILYKMKNSDEYCTTTVQLYSYENKDLIIKDWEPNTIKSIYFITPCKTCGGACFSASYNRTPEEIILVLSIIKAISVDIEVEGAYAKYDLLPLWKDRQIKEGFR